MSAEQVDWLHMIRSPACSHWGDWLVGECSVDEGGCRLSLFMLFVRCVAERVYGCCFHYLSVEKKVDRGARVALISVIT